MKVSTGSVLRVPFGPRLASRSSAMLCLDPGNSELLSSCSWPNHNPSTTHKSLTVFAAPGQLDEAVLKFGSGNYRLQAKFHEECCCKLGRGNCQYTGGDIRKLTSVLCQISPIAWRAFREGPYPASMFNVLMFGVAIRSVRFQLSTLTHEKSHDLNHEWRQRLLSRLRERIPFSAEVRPTLNRWFRPLSEISRS